MPIGGIGTGSIWLDGQGRLAVWQIFNNLSEPRVPDSFFAVRARVGGQEPVTRVLQTVAEAGFKPVESLEYEGRLSDRAAHVSRFGVAGRDRLGSAESDDPARRGEFVDPLCAVSPDGDEPEQDARPR